MPKLLIGPYETGLENDVRPWLLPEEAFSTLEDAYVWRGRVKRRKGFNLYGNNQLTSRLGMSLGVTGGSPFAGIIPNAIPIPSPGRQMFSIGTVILTSNNPGAGIQNLISTDPAYTGTLNNTTGAYVINHPVIVPTNVYYYPGLPVMGLCTREAPAINVEDIIAFDTQWAYRRTGGRWDRLDTAPGYIGTWTGTDADFFWSCNYRGLTEFNRYFFVVNGMPADNIKYIPQGATLWVNLRPQLNTGVANRWLDTAKIIFPFKNRLLVLNTIETIPVSGQQSYPNRARWSLNGDPRNPATSWIDDVAGSGGYIDAPTSEAITSAQFIKDRVLVFFERSTWELVYTANEILPFVWKQINTELGCESPFSQISFDDVVLGVGNRGIHAANSNGVERIDIKIPDEVLNINNPDAGPNRVYGIRDFERELVYWSFPSFVKDYVFPNRVLVYNYRNKSFAFFNDCFTCYGYYNRDAPIAWNNLPYKTWSTWNIPWNSGTTQLLTSLVTAGNQQGWTFLFEDTGSNCPSLMITGITNATRTITVPNHNLQSGQYVRFATVNGIASGMDLIYLITYVDVNNFSIDDPASVPIVGVYTGGGTVEVLNNIDILTKNFPFFYQQNQNAKIIENQFLLTKTQEGEITTHVYLNSNTSEAIIPSLGTNIVNTHAETGDLFNDNSDELWHKQFNGAVGASMQLEITLSDAQMRDASIQESDIILHAILLNVEPAGRMK